MYRTLVDFLFVLTALAVALPPTPLQAAEPAPKGAAADPAIAGGNTYTGGTTVNAGTLNLAGAGGATAQFLAAPIPAAPITAVPGAVKVFYVVVEGAGLGENVRAFPCTGSETVLDAISQIGGLAQISGTKMWIARPSPTNREASTIVPVDWDAVAKRGINATNHVLLPGDRLVVGEDPLVARSNAIAKKTAPVERLMGIVSLSVSCLGSLTGPTAGTEAVKDMVRKGLLTDDEELKNIVLEAIRRHEDESKKGGAKEADAKPSR